MAEFLANGFPVTTQDAFTDTLTLGPASGVRQIILSVLGVNAVIIQCWKYTDGERKEKWILEPFTRVLAGQSIGVILKNCAGIRIANATAGKSSLVTAELDFETDIDLSGGSITSAAIDGSGNIIPAPGLAVTRSILTGSGTYTTPPTARALLVEAVAPGGGGGGCRDVGNASQGSAGGGGASGGYSASIIESPAASYAFTIGAAGAAGAAGVGGSGGGGGTGGDTNFGNIVIAKGGNGGGGGGVSGGVGLAGGPGLGVSAGAAGQVITAGNPGQNGWVFSNAAANVKGGNGGAAPGPYSNETNGPSAAGGSLQGGAGGGPGSGGSGACNSGTIGAGAAGGPGGIGFIVVTEFY